MAETKDERATNLEIRRLAILNWVPSEIARQPEKLKSFENDLAKAIAAHSITFMRYGDFLAVMQTRDGKKIMKAVQLIREYAKNEKGEPTSLRPASISFDAGMPPVLDCAGWATETWSEEKWFNANPDYRGRNFSGHFLYGNYYGEDPAPRVRIETGLASPSVDDQITFDGSGASILVPYGTGDEVFQRLLKTLGQRQAALSPGDK